MKFGERAIRSCGERPLTTQRWRRATLSGLGLMVSMGLASACASAKGDKADEDLPRPMNMGDAGTPSGSDEPSETPGEPAGDDDTPGNPGPSAMVDGGAGGSDVVDACVSNREFLATQAWPQVFGTLCFACHGPGGEADLKNADFELQPAAYPGFLDINMQNIDRMVRTKEDDVSLLLLRPMGVDHGGGKLVSEGSAQYEVLLEMISRLESGEDACAEDARVVAFEDVELLDPVASFRKASLQLNGRLPTPAEIDALTAEGELALPGLVRGLFEEDAFYARLLEVFNDQWLTDRYIRDGQGVLNDDDFPRVDTYYDSLTPEDQVKARRSVAQEPLQLMAYIVRNDRPFTEIVTADYTVLNPFTANVYNRAGMAFQNPYDEFEFKTGTIRKQSDTGDYVEWPHAGILSSPMFLNRYPTSRTNRNRHRARIVLREFLATDILKVADRPIDPTDAVNFANPTREDPACNTCHAVIDPIAGAFMKFDDNDQERYLPERDWHAEMPLPGFGGEAMMTSDYPESLQWLGQRVAADARFPLSVVANVYESLAGAAPEPFPEEANVGRFISWSAQDETIRAIADAFVQSNFNLKVAVEQIVLSPYYRASNTTATAPERLAQLANVGTAQLLTPELLNRKIKAIFGYEWMSGNTPALLGNYEILYGGIDSETVTERLTVPNGIMGAIMWRMANEMSCRAVSADFSLPRAERRLLPNVGLETFPEDDIGQPNDKGLTAIGSNLRYLHALLLGESISEDSPEFERLMELFQDTWREGRNKMLRGEVEQNLPFDCRYRVDPFTLAEVPEAAQLISDPNYTVRAWMAVVTYLMSDYRFLHE